MGSNALAWEYIDIFYPDRPTGAQLSEAGTDGWELVSVIEAPETRGGWVAYFKRPLERTTP